MPADADTVDAEPRIGVEAPGQRAGVVAPVGEELGEGVDFAGFYRDDVCAIRNQEPAVLWGRE